MYFGKSHTRKLIDVSVTEQQDTGLETKIYVSLKTVY